MLAIDIGSRKVCIAEGSYKGGAAAVTACAEIEYEGEIVTNGAIEDRSALSFLINEIIKTNKMSSKAAVVTLYSSDIVARDFRLPDVKPPQLKLLVQNEMARIVGEDSGFLFDYIVTGAGEDKLLDVTAYAVATEMVEDYYKLISDLKLTPFALDVQANSLAKLLSGTTINGRPNTQGNVIVADIGYSKISFHGFSDGAPRFNRTDVSPMQEFVREIGSISRADVTAELMSKLDLSPDAEHESLILADTCKYFVYRLSEEFQRYVQYTHMNSEVKTVEKIYICGGTACIKGLDAALTELLRVPVETVRNVGKLILPASLSAAKVLGAAGALIRN